MNNKKHGIIKSFFRFLGCWNWEKARTIEEDEIDGFTGTGEEGIAAAFDIQHKKMLKHYYDLKDAIKKVEDILEEKKAALNNAPNQETRAEITQAIEKISQSIGPYKQQLQEFKTQIDTMPQQKAEAISDFTPPKKEVEENDKERALPE